MRRVLLVVPVAVLVVTLGGCGRGGTGGGGEARQSTASTASGDPAGQDGQRRGPLGVVPMPLAAGPAHIELTALSRTSDKVVTGQLRVHNDGAAI
jgi:hypothetical protein